MQHDSGPQRYKPLENSHPLEGCWKRWIAFLDRFSDLLLTIAAVLFAVGLIWIVALLSTTGLEAYAKGPNENVKEALFKADLKCGLWFTLLGALLGCIGGFRYWTKSPGTDTCECRESSNPPTDPSMVPGYNRALVGIGYAIVLLGTLNFVALAGFAKTGHLNEIFQPSKDFETTILVSLDRSKSSADTPDTDPVEPDPATAEGGGVESEGEAQPTAKEIKQLQRLQQVRRMIRILLLPGYAILGALFFVAGTLRLNRDRAEKSARADDVSSTQRDEDRIPPGPFSSSKFWGGLWYRLGEGIVFSLVLLILVGSGITVESNEHEPWLLVLALIIGMFVKPAEILINGLAQRLFKAVETFVK